MSAELAARWLRLAAARIAEQRAWLTDLDAAIGDGDHGINLDRGFDIVLARLDRGDLAADQPGLLLLGAGRLITGTVGGASGALYGRAFMRAGARLEAGATSLGDLADALREATEAIATLGRSRPGEKTMLDALAPAVEALSDGVREGALLAEVFDRAAAAAEAGALETIPMLATKGRASYLGERSIGHLDPGAASSALLLRALADALADA